MNPEAMHPFGLALVDFAAGKTDASFIIRRDDGLETPLPVVFFFRDAGELTVLETLALERCKGRILDIGAGTGLHTRILQSRGFEAEALDICPQAVEYMLGTGISDVHRADIFNFRGGGYDTLLLLGHGIGMVEDMDGLKRFLELAGRLIQPGGILLVHSLDAGRTDEPAHLKYHEENRRNGCYFGQTRIRLVYDSVEGPWYGWLHVDPDTLAGETGKAGWSFRILFEGENGEYLAECSVQTSL